MIIGAFATHVMFCILAHLKLGKRDTVGRKKKRAADNLGAFYSVLSVGPGLTWTNLVFIPDT